MWEKEYRDYKTDQANVKYSIEPSHGMDGCEMHEIYGWGNTLHQHKKKKKGFFGSFILYLFRTKDEEV